MKSRPGMYALLWGCFLGISAAALWLWSYSLPRGVVCSSATCGEVPALAPALLTAAAVASATLGVVLIVRSVEGTDRSRRPVVDQSLASVIAAIGLGMIALGGAVGAGLVWIGLVIAGLGFAGVVRESLALRRLRRRGPTG